MKSTAKSTRDFRTGEQYSRVVNKTAVVRGTPRRTVVKVTRNTTNYMDMPTGGRRAVTDNTTTTKKVYKNGVLKRTRNY